jgi:hypothetical protein
LSLSSFQSTPRCAGYYPNLAFADLCIATDARCGDKSDRRAAIGLVLTIQRNLFAKSPLCFFQLIPISEGRAECETVPVVFDRSPNNRLVDPCRFNFGVFVIRVSV